MINFRILIKQLLYVFSFVCCLFFSQAYLHSQDISNSKTFYSLPPVLITSCGQSPDAFSISAIARRIGFEYFYDDLFTSSKFDAFRTVIIVMGASQKGLGEAGLSVSMELSRVSALLKKAKTVGAKVIAVHIGGEARRGADSEKFIDLVIALADCIIVTNRGNEDGKFSKESERLGIPLFLIKAPKDIEELLLRLLKI